MTETGLGSVNYGTITQGLAHCGSAYVVDGSLCSLDTAPKICHQGNKSQAAASTIVKWGDKSANHSTRVAISAQSLDNCVVIYSVFS